MSSDMFRVLDCTSYDLSKTNNDYIDDQLVISIKDIDDLAIVWITYESLEDDTLVPFLRIEEDKNGKLVPLAETEWLWRIGVKHGEAGINITQCIHNNWNKLVVDNNPLYLIVAIYDFEYKAIILKGGKWSFDAKLKLNGKPIWEKYDFGVSEDGKYGLKYLKIIKIKILDHKLMISQSIPESTIIKIYNKIISDYNYKSSNALENTNV